MTLPIGHKYTIPNSPQHIYQLTALLLRESFRTFPEDHPYRYTDDFDTTRLVVDTAFNRDAGVHGKRPIAIIRRGPVATSDRPIGDTGTATSRGSASIKTATIRSSVSAQAICATRAEADGLGMELFNFFVFCRTRLPALVPIQYISEVSLSEVSRMDLEEPAYTCTAMFGYTMSYKWNHVEKDVPLAQVTTHFNTQE